MTPSARALIVGLAVALVLAVLGLGLFAIRASQDRSRSTDAGDRLLEYITVRMDALAVPPNAGFMAQVPLPMRLEYVRAMALAGWQELRVYTSLRGQNDDIAAVTALLDRYRQHLDAVTLRTADQAQARALDALMTATYEDFRRLTQAMARPAEGLAEAGRIAREGAAAAYLSRPGRPLQVTTSRDPYPRGERVLVRVLNIGEETLELPSSAPVTVYQEVTRGEWRPVFALRGTQAIERLGPSETREWVWDQKNQAGQQVPLGRYEARVTAVGWQEHAFTVRFQVR